MCAHCRAHQGPRVHAYTGVSGEFKAYCVTRRFLTESSYPGDSTVLKRYTRCYPGRVADQIPTVGDVAPDFTLPDDSGKPVTLAQLTSGNGLVLIFYRGLW